MRLDLDKVELAAGGHGSPSDGLCVMEAVAYIAGEQHSDHPVCVSPVIGAFMRHLNDNLPDDLRQQLKALIPVVMDTRSTDEDELRRGFMCADWAVRVVAPMALRAAGLVEEAGRLERLAPVVDKETAHAAVDAAAAHAADAAAYAAAAAADAAHAAAAHAAWSVVLPFALDLIERLAWLKDDVDA